MRPVRDCILEYVIPGVAVSQQAVPAHVAKAAEKALEAAELRTGFESGVAAEAPADVTKLGAFMSYIKMEQNAGDSSRVQVRVLGNLE